MFSIFKRKNTNIHEEVIEFELSEGKIVQIKNHNSFQTRGESTIKMVMDALKRNPIDFTGTFKVYTGDFPTGEIESNAFYYSCNSSKKLEQTLPDFVFDGWPQAGIPSYELVTQEIATNGELPYKSPKLLWIGNSKTHSNRDIFLSIAAEYPHFIDAFNTCVDQFVLHKEAVKYISLQDHTQYKYLIDIEGRGYSGRLKLLLFSKRLLFIQDRPWKEFYHFDLKPYVHYIPVKRDLSDLIAQINFVESQGEEYYNTIANNAYLYASENLRYDQAITRITKLLTQTLST